MRLGIAVAKTCTHDRVARVVLSERGSWDPQGDAWGSQGGRLYVTCMSLYMLEVYYRYLPLYQDSAVNPRR